MTEQERIAAALAYQQAQQPAMMNPNLARQGARGRENMMPPTSIMDERYPAFKRNQEDAEKLMLGLDIVGSAIPLAGPAAKGAVALGKYAAPQIAQGLENYAFRTGMALPMDVWHGTPHKFPPTAKNPLGEFDPTKIGTGEGAQAYGYGHYLAEAPETAKTYKNAVGYVTNDPNRLAAKEVSFRGNENDALRYLQRILPNKGEITSSGESYQLIQDAIASIKNGEYKIPSGSLYKVDLPDEVVARMLDYDKPINQQAPAVLEALKRASINTESSALAGPMAQGQETHLAKFGIPGIKYLDEASRGAGTGTRNFVVFPGNEGLLNILGRE